MLMYLLHMGMKKGWWKDIDSSPLYAPAGRLVVDDVAAHEDLGESTCGLLSSKSVKDSNKYMSRLKGSTSSNAQLASMILASTVTHRCSEIKFWLAQPVRQAFGMMVSQLKTPRGTHHWLVDMASDGYRATLLAVWDTLTSAVGALSLTFHGDAALAAEELSEEGVIAKVAFEFACHLIGIQSMWSTWYSSHFPGMFLKLLGPQAVRDKALKTLKQIFDKLEVDERKAPGDAPMSKVLHNLQFPKHSLVREWLVLLAEWQFKLVPQALHDAIKQMAYGLGTSKLVEDMFKGLTDVTRHSPNGQLSRRARWFQQVEGQCLADFGRETIPSSGARIAKKRNRHMPKDIFSAKRCNFSLGEDELRKITGPASWPNPTPQGMQNLPALTSWWMDTPSDRSHAFSRSYFNLLALVGTIIKCPDTERTWLVLYVCEHGLRCLEVRGERYKERGVFMRKMESNDVFGFVRITDPETWKVIEVLPRSPAAFRILSEDSICNKRYSGVVMLKDGNSATCLQSAARKGFEALTAPMLQKLLKHYEIKTKARTKRGMVEELYKKAFPMATSDQMKEALDAVMDKAHVLDKASVLLKGEFAEIASDVLDKDEHIEVLKHKAKKAPGGTTKTEIVPRPVDYGGASSSVGSGVALVPATAMPPAPPPVPSSDKPSVPKQVYRGSWTPVEAKAFAPPGASIARDNVRFYRWQVTCTWIKPPEQMSTSLAYGKKGSLRRQLDSLLHCYKWAWARYLKLNPGLACPFDLDALFEVGAD